MKSEENMKKVKSFWSQTVWLIISFGAAVAILKKDKETCFKHIQTELEENYESNYKFKNWIVFDPIKEDKRFIALYKK